MTPNPGTGNPILDEIDRAHSTLSPEAQEAIRRAGAAAIPQNPLGTPADPFAGKPVSAPRPAPAPLAMAPSASPTAETHTARLAQLTAPPVPGLEHTKASTGQSGIGQIHNPVGRTLLQVADAVGGGLFPGIEQRLPGTQGHHDVLVRQAKRDVTSDEAAQKAEDESAFQGAQTENLKGEAPLHEAQTNEANARAESLRSAPDKPTNEWIALTEPVIDPANPGLGPQPAFYNKNDASIKYGNVSVAAKPVNKEPKEVDQPLGGDRVKQINQAMTARYQVLHPKAQLPEHYLLPDKATQKDFERTDKLIEGEEKAFGTDQNRKQTEELRKQTQTIAAQNRTDRQDTATRQAAYKAYTPAMDSAERFNVMTKNYEDATKNNDQQAMLSLLANHLGMTMGLQKGARMTKDIIQEAEKSRPWLQGMAAKFDKDGYLSGVTLTPEQMSQMVNLGRERFSEDLTKARSEANYLGAKDEGPDRVPNKSTINHYIGLANGDPRKAKQLAAADGWTVKP